MLDPRRTTGQRKQTLVQLNEALLTALDDVATEEGRSRSAVIRDALVAYLDARMSRSIDQQMIDGYTRIPQEGDDLESLAHWGARGMIAEEPW